VYFDSKTFFIVLKLKFTYFPPIGKQKQFTYNSTLIQFKQSN